MLNIKTLRILNFLFILLIIFEIIFLIIYSTIYPALWQYLLFFTLPFVLLTGFFAVFYKTILHAIAFLIINFVPITIALCNILEFDYFDALDDQTLINLNKSNVEILKELDNEDDDKEEYKIVKELDENVSKNYIRQHIPVIIILGIFQFTFIMLCITLLKTSILLDVHIIYQLEEIFFIITISFIGIWISEIYIIFHGQLGEVFGTINGIIVQSFGIITAIPICIVFIAIQRRSKILYCLFYFASILKVLFIIGWLYECYLSFASDGAIPTMLSLIILNVNTVLCQFYVDKEVVSQIYGTENKLILIKRTVMFFKNIFGKTFGEFLKFLEKEPDLDLKKLGIDEWKFKPELEISLLKIISVKNYNNNNNYAVEDVSNDNDTSKIDLSVEISFNAESDVMIQTNYPLPYAFEEEISSISSFSSPPISLMEYCYYEITILSNQNIDETIIAIGLASNNFSTDRLPGCDTHSVGFHSDEGRTFHNEGYTGSKYAVKWGKVNDVIGCGYYPSTGQVFFTMNGEYLGIAYTGLFHSWYPTIGSNGICSLKVNFGQEEFEYKEANGMSIAGMIHHEANDNIEIITIA
ncbi:concanavalin A-like lectin/glucanase domain-containing protein [Rhizophagus clarus]|uniref:Concanavalin A-like lectin/glucanase domain-containing protein n=1 Tax=Rhizophagus clarus TaxID=94130 RepID=A0A8H3M481_9GLOM|nr:concanavalin A-like lectin/glucanase domain-containing protein [Rhizophagus clarus]